MKLSILSLAVASAGLLASANPMRVVIVSSENHVDSGPVAQLVRPADAAHAHVPPVAITVGPYPPKKAGGCAGARWRQKATSLAESFRIALGFGEHKHHAQHHDDKNGAIAFKPIPTSPLPFIGTPHANGLAPNGKTPGGDWVHISHSPHHQHNGERPSFLMRLQFALMSLGPWESGAVAFVLGCGIGVLLRMAFVFTVLFFRAFRSRRSIELEEYTVVELDSDAEEMFVAPPVYTYPVEKAEAEVAIAPAAEESK